MLLAAKKKFRLKESTKPHVDAALFQWFTWNSDNSNFLLIQSFCWDIEIRIMWTTLYQNYSKLENTINTANNTVLGFHGGGGC